MIALTNYWYLPLWLLLIGGGRLLVRRESGLPESDDTQWGRIPAILALLPYVLWAAGRPDSFGDTGVYRARFLHAPASISGLTGYVKSQPRDWGYAALETLFRTFISHSDLVFFLAVAAVQLICLGAVYRRYSKNYWLSIFLFVASTDYLSWMWNGTRQFLAAALIFAGLPLLVRRRYGPMVLLTLAAACFHLSALLFLPFIFLVQGKPWNRRLLLFLAAVLAACYGLNRGLAQIAPALAGTPYASQVERLLGDGGVHPLRALFYGIPALLSLVFRERLPETDNPLIPVCVNLSIVSAGFYLLGVFTSGLLVGRIPIYFSLAGYILIPWMIQTLFTARSAALAELGFLAVYSAFFYYQMHMTWDLI